MTSHTAARLAKITRTQSRFLHHVMCCDPGGGYNPPWFYDYRVVESLREKRLVRYAGRRAANWFDNFYYITDAGRAALKAGAAT